MIYLSKSQTEEVKDTIKKIEPYLQKLHVHIGNVKKHFKKIFSEILINPAQVHDIEEGISSTEELTIIKFQTWALNFNLCRRIDLIKESLLESSQGNTDVLGYHEEMFNETSDRKEALLDAMQQFIDSQRKNESLWGKVTSLFK